MVSDGGASTGVEMVGGSHRAGPSLNGGALASQKCHFVFVTGVLEKDVRKKGHVVGLTLKRTKLKRGGGCELGLEFCWIWFVVG